MKFLKMLFQLGVIGASCTFLYFGYVHLEGNTRFLKALQEAKNTYESRFLSGHLRALYPKIEGIDPVETSADDSVHFFKLKQKEGTPLVVARVQKDIACESCKDLDFLLVTDTKGTVQKVKLLSAMEYEGKKVDPTVFLKQFEGKIFTSPIVIGKDVEGLKEAPLPAQSLTEAISETLPKIQEKIKQGKIA
jgi:hypothetical protein